MLAEMISRLKKKEVCFTCCLFLVFFFFAILSFPQEINEPEQSGVLKAIVLSRANNVLEAKIILSSYSTHNLFELSQPNRIVIDLFDMAAKETRSYIFVDDPEIKTIRTGMFKQDVTRIVFDLSGQIPFYRIERIPVGLRLLVGEQKAPSELGEATASNKIQRESPNDDGVEKQIREMRESIGRIDGKLEDIKEMLRETLQTQGRIKTQPAEQRDNVSEQQTQIPSLDQSFSEERMVQAVVLDLDSIDVDGNLDEMTWGEASFLTDFTQHEPIEGAPATEKTEAKIFFGKDSIYIGVRAFDSDPERIKSILARRDSRCPSDWIRVYIDSYHDHRTAFEFSVNPCGVKRDVFWSGDRRPDDDWDAVWDVEVSQDELGWMAEFKIPYSQIRYAEKDVHTWGFQISRVIARKNETSHWRHVPKGVPRFVSLFGDLNEIRGIPAPKRLEVLPYTVGRSSFQPQEEGNPFQTGSDYLANGGLDLKYGVSSNLTLDAAFNPDFGQVEADPAEVNLTAFETYFPEKRPFFIEGKNMMSFPLGGMRGRESLFYSRRIGRSPQGDPSSALYTYTPENSTILGALKLTGKTAQGWNIGLMEALTGREKATLIFEDGERGEEAVEPLTNYFLGRAEKEFRDGRSAVGMIFTAVNRRIEEENLSFLPKSAFAGGINFRHRWSNDTYEISGSATGSNVLGSKEAIQKVQEAPAHYYQRPDAPHLGYDPERTSLSGYSSSFDLRKIGGGHWRWSLGGMVRSPGFETNDMGYLRYADWFNQSISVSYWEFKPGKIFREYNLSLSYTNDWDYALTHLDHRENLRGRIQFLNYWNIHFNLSRESDHLKIDYLRGGPAMITPVIWRYGGSFSTDHNKDFFLNLSANFTAYEDGARSYRLSSDFNLRPFSNLSLRFSPQFSDGFNRLQYVTTIDVDDQSHYLLSRIDQTTLSFTLRVNYTVAPNLSFQLYAQPYVSAGAYSEFKEVVQPRAKEYDDRWHIFEEQEISLRDDDYRLFLPWSEGQEVTFGNPDFNFRQFRLNFVVRWEYLPGSILYLVWTNGMNDYAEVGTLSLRDDFRSLFRSEGNNVFLLKISYWFNL